MLDKEDQSFVEVGSVDIRSDMTEVIQVITENVRSLSNKIAIEGHTDARPYGPNNPYSNWELSSGRANAARRVMEASGLDPSRLEALHGYGSSRLRYPDQPYDPRNRRVAIVLRHVR
jgi:chemotaxis protein MotB